MRFWPFGKRQRAETDEAPPGPVAPPPPVAPEPAPPPPTGAWRHLPALRPTTSALALTAPVQRLTDTITSTQRPRVAASRLGHARLAGGPTGTVAGLVRQQRVTHGDAEGVALRFAHAPEPVEAEAAVPIRPWGSQQRLPAATSPSPAAPSHPATPAAATAPADTERPATPLPPRPARAMPARTFPAPLAPEPAAADPAPTVAPATQRLTDPAPTIAPATRRVTDPAPAVAPATERLAEPPPMAPVTQRLADPTPTVPPASTMPEHSVERSVVETSMPSRPDAPTLGSTRIVRRVGAPMRSRPPSMVDAVASETPPAAADHAQRLPVAVEPDLGATASGPISGSAPTVVPSAPGELPAPPARPMTAASRPPDGAASPTPVARVRTTGDAPLVGSAPAIQRLSGRAPSSTIPKLTNPAEPTEAPSVVPVRRGVQRAPESVPPTVRSELEPVLGESLADVEVHRGPETGAAARSIQAKAFTTGGAVYLPDEIGSTASGEGRKVLAHELTHVVQQRALGGSLPSEDSVEGARLESEARIVGGQDPVPTRPLQPAARPAAAAPAQRLAGSPMPDVVRPLAPVAGSGPTVAAGSAMPSSSQAAIVATVRAAATRAGVPSSPPSSAVPSGGVSAPAPAPTVQRLTGDAAQASAEATRPAGAAAAPTATDVSAPGGARPGSESDIEDLARQLYPKFRTRLRRDLLADRERSGRLFDR